MSRGEANDCMSGLFRYTSLRRSREVERRAAAGGAVSVRRRRMESREAESLACFLLYFFLLAGCCVDYLEAELAFFCADDQVVAPFERTVEDHAR